MIKNILYSFFFHFSLFAIIYFGFKKYLPEQDIIEIKGISVGVFDISNKNQNKITAKNNVKDKNYKNGKDKNEKKTEKSKNKEKKLEKKSILQKEEISQQKEIAKNEKNDDKIDEIKEESKNEIENKKDEKNEDLKSQNNDGGKIYKNQEIIDQLENINLTPREKFNIQSQLNSCFYRVLQDKKIEENFEIEIILQLLQDGSIIFDKNENIDFLKYESEKSYKNMIDNVILATQLCSPFRNLPDEKYEFWQKFRVKFIFNDGFASSKND